MRERLTGVGQFAEVGKPLGRIYADDTAEIRLPLTPAQAAYLQAPDEAGKLPGARVTLRVETGAQPLQRQARIVRREGVVDPGTGLEYWVARLDHLGQAPAILPGTFVSADIEGRERDGIFVLPQTALNAAQEALLVDADNRLRIKRLTVLRRDAERVLVGDGLSAGDRLIVSGIDMPVPGMEVVVDEPVQVVDESIR